MTIKAYVWWSIYVRTASVKKLKAEHLPPIHAALESVEFEWEILKESENPGLLRLVTCQNETASTVAGVVVPVLRRAYRLADGWSISGLQDLAANELRHIAGQWSKRKPTNRPPALESMVFEIEQGQISHLTADGGWKVIGQPGRRAR